MEYFASLKTEEGLNALPYNPCNLLGFDLLSLCNTAALHTFGLFNFLSQTVQRFLSLFNRIVHPVGLTVQLVEF